MVYNGMVAFISSGFGGLLSLQVGAKLSFPVRVSTFTRVVKNRMLD